MNDATPGPPNEAFNITNLYDRLQKAAEAGKPTQLSATEVDWLIVSGAHARLLQVAAEHAYVEATKRLEANGYDLSFLRTKATAIEPVACTSDVPLAVEDGPLPEVLSVPLLAKHWRVSQASVYNLLKSGKLSHFKLGDSLYRIRREHVEEYERRPTARRS